MKIRIQLSDPWDLGESIGWRPLVRELRQTTANAHGELALVRLDEPLEHHGTPWRFFIVPYTPGFIATISRAV
jgi:hypothetical protein